jgi:hypothetical protein
VEDDVHGRGTFTWADGRVFTGTFAAESPVAGEMKEAGGARFAVVYAANCAKIFSNPTPTSKVRAGGGGSEGQRVCAALLPSPRLTPWLRRGCAQVVLAAGEVAPEVSPEVRLPIGAGGQPMQNVRGHSQEASFTGVGYYDYSNGRSAAPFPPLLLAPGLTPWGSWRQVRRGVAEWEEARPREVRLRQRRQVRAAGPGS